MREDRFELFSFEFLRDFENCSSFFDLLQKFHNTVLIIRKSNYFFPLQISEIHDHS